MYGYGSLLVLIKSFIEYMYNLDNFSSFKNCQICKLSILMAVRGGGGQTKSYILLFIGHEKLEFTQEKVRKFYRQSCVGTLEKL